MNKRPQVIYTPELLEKQRAHNLKSRIKVREEMLDAYGRKCACCGESQTEFLSLDHINGNGNRDRKQLGLTAGTNFYSYLRRNGWPKGFRVLCYNCNCSLGFRGYCPHNRDKGGH